jgi:hypothetical protein
VDLQESSFFIFDVNGEQTSLIHEDQIIDCFSDRGPRNPNLFQVQAIHNPNQLDFEEGWILTSSS